MTYDNPIRGRLNAWFFRFCDGYINVLLGDRKRSLFAGHPNEIVEIGPGVGANFRYLSLGTRVLAVEPNPQMHGALRAMAVRHGVSVDLVERSADDTGLPDDSVDWVVCTLVLCTVTDPAATLSEIRRHPATRRSIRVCRARRRISGVVAAPNSRACATPVAMVLSRAVTPTATRSSKSIERASPTCASNTKPSRARSSPSIRKSRALRSPEPNERQTRPKTSRIRIDSRDPLRSRSKAPSDPTSYAVCAPRRRRHCCLRSSAPRHGR